MALPEETGIILLIFATAFLSTSIFIYQRLASGKGLIVDLCKSLKIDKIKSLKLKEKKISSFEKLIIKFFRHDKTDFLITMIISLLSWILMFLEFKFGLLILGYNVSFSSIFLIISFLGAALLIPIPLGLGAMEASQIAVFPIIGMKTSTGVAISMLTRARDIVWSIISLMLLCYYGLSATKTIKKALLKQ